MLFFFVYFVHSWKPTYEILKKHGEYLKNEIKALEEATENERYLWSHEMRFPAAVLSKLTKVISKTSAACIEKLLQTFQEFKVTCKWLNN